ncbi:RNA chaperone Hfq [Methanothrix harundinacea]|uniref:RNA chaperone Hfq n=1 Tax=Methanothrix harundinacea TaxID=301375 RepID=UPI00064E508A|nr:RNA chaperone Hfq [Methanothrix harundinacea]
MFLDEKGEEEGKKDTAKPKQFIPRALGQKVTIRLLDGRPLIAKLEAQNNYELLLDLGKGKKMIVFKHAIGTLEYEAQDEGR